MSSARLPVLLLPGAIMPADVAYGPLIAELGPDADARPKDLELYAGTSPPPGDILALEVAGIDRAADAAGFDRFHLVGYSAGGAAGLAYAIARPGRLRSLALIEPAFAGWHGMSDEERAHFERFGSLLDLDDERALAAFTALQVAPGVDAASPPGDPPAWMARRPAGVRALLRAFLASDLDVRSLAAFDRPAWLAVGGRSHPDYWARMAGRLAGVLPDLVVETFPERHHFDPPHRAEAHRVADALRGLWHRAEAAQAAPGQGSGARRG